jgi:DNA sulfur modification protein DndD
MRIEKIELKNFRQYHGEQEIVLAGTEDDEKIVTVIYGKNGRGKTGLYRAVMYCIFGDKVLDQDSNYESPSSSNMQNIYLANTLALQEDFESDKKGIECSVKISFLNQGVRYEMFRSFYAIQELGGRIIQEEKDLKLSFNSDGNTIVLGPLEKDKIEELINKILDNRVKNFFLFDGERIERLTKVTQTQKKDIQRGIRNLLKIDELFDTQRTLVKLNNKLTNELSKVSTGDYKKKLNEKKKIEETLDSLKLSIESTEKEIAIAERQIQILDEELDKFKDSEQLIRERKQTENAVKQLENNKDLLLAKLRSFSTDASIILAKDLLNEVFVDIEQQNSKGELPSEIKKELIDRLLEEMSCICGRPIAKNSTEYMKLESWNREASSRVFEVSLMDFYGLLSKSIENSKFKNQEILGSLQELGNLEEELDRVKQHLRKLEEELEGVPDSDIASKNKERSSIISKKAILDHSLINFKSDLDTSKSKLDLVNVEIKRLSGASLQHANLQNKLNIVIKACETVERIIQNFMEQMREELQLQANKNFLKLLDEDGQKTLKEIVVNEDYTLEVLDWQGRNFLANISAGQRQVVSLSFITALAQVAGGSNILELPLFMDTPFGRLSGEHRDNLLKEIPGITPQWVLLVTDEEFNYEDGEVLKNSNKWGKFYVLEAVKSGVTKIKEVSVSQYKSVLSSM